MRQMAFDLPEYIPPPPVAEAIRQHRIAIVGTKRWREREMFRATYEQLKRETGK